MTRYKLKQWYPSLPKDWEVGQELIKYKAYSNIPNYIPEECIPIAFNIKGVSEYEVENNPEFWEKVEDKPILITEDGVEIFKNEKFWVIDRNFDIGEGRLCSDIFSDIFNAISYKHFSTKELAEKYIEENKPMYSKKDMLGFGASMSSKLYPYQCEGCLEHWKRFKKEKGE